MLNQKHGSAKQIKVQEIIIFWEINLGDYLIQEKMFGFCYLTSTYPPHLASALYS